MSGRNESDNQNTQTTYIPPELKAQAQRRVQQYPQQRRPQSQPRPQQPAQPQYNGQYPEQQYYGDPYYGQQPYQGQPPYGYPPPQYGQDYPPPQYGQGYPPPQYGGQYQQPQPQRRPPQNKKKKKKSSSKSSSGRSSSAPKKKRRKKSLAAKLAGRLIRTLLVIFLILFALYSCTAMTFINKMEKVDTGYRNRRADALSRNHVTNVLLIGTDGRTADDNGRSDTVILASINKNTHKISLISLMRDCYVSIPGYGQDKLNAAYSYGGPSLLMDTVENNFGIKVDDFVSLNFISFANIVDSVGGIDVSISDAERQEINTILQAEVNRIMGDDVFDDLLDECGKIHLNGKQALSYARIRYVGNADFERTSRQREVIELVMNKVKKPSLTMLPKLSTSVLPGISTNMDTGQLYLLSLQVPFMLSYDRQQLQVPADGTFYGQSTDSGDALIVDFEANYNMIYNTAYAE